MEHPCEGHMAVDASIRTDFPAVKPILLWLISKWPTCTSGLPSYFMPCWAHVFQSLIHCVLIVTAVIWKNLESKSSLGLSKKSEVNQTWHSTTGTYLSWRSWLPGCSGCFLSWQRFQCRTLSLGGGLMCKNRKTINKNLEARLCINVKICIFVWVG